MKRLVLVLLLVSALLVPAMPALADDNGVYSAYVSRDADFARLGKQVRRGLRVWKQSDYRRSEPVLTALRRTGALCTSLIGDIEAQEASSDAGRRAKSEAIASVRYLRGSTTAAAGGVRAVKRGQRSRALRLSRKTKRLASRSQAAERRAQAAFREAGVEVN